MAYAGQPDVLGRSIVATGARSSVCLQRFLGDEEGDAIVVKWAEWDAIVAGVEADRPTEHTNVERDAQ